MYYVNSFKANVYKTTGALRLGFRDGFDIGAISSVLWAVPIISGLAGFYFGIDRIESRFILTIYQLSQITTIVLGFTWFVLPLANIEISKGMGRLVELVWFVASLGGIALFVLNNLREVGITT